MRPSMTALTPEAPHVPPLTDDACWQAVVGRDARFDGRFLFGVKTTGVYCRPSCGARQPKRENVSFFQTVEEARAAGFRACKRCRPDEKPDERLGVQAVRAAARMIETAIANGDPAPGLEALARRAGYAPHHFHRLFRKATGVTPKAYAAAQRSKAATSALAAEPRVTDAIYAAGYSSSSRFYDAAKDRLGMTPSARRHGGAGETIRYVFGDCSLGRVVVAETERGVCAVEFGDGESAMADSLKRRFPQARLEPGTPARARHLDAVIAAIEGLDLNPHLPLDVRGTAFQERVWRALRAIPAGSTATYAEIAAAIGSPAAVRAVAGACAANPTAVLIPCHRVIRADGDLSGYRWGRERKAKLLARERG